jgi:ATP-dependent Clp protease adaptor protein ClpS
MHMAHNPESLSTTSARPISGFAGSDQRWQLMTSDFGDSSQANNGESRVGQAYAHQLTFTRTPATMNRSIVDRGGVVVPTQTQIRPEEDIGTGLGQPWMVILFNDDHHAFDEVIAQVQKATGCSPEEAFQITYAAHTNGQSVAYVGDKPQCQQVAKVLREIDLHVELEEA